MHPYDGHMTLFISGATWGTTALLGFPRLGLPLRVDRVVLAVPRMISPTSVQVCWVAGAAEGAGLGPA